MMMDEEEYYAENIGDVISAKVMVDSDDSEDYHKMLPDGSDEVTCEDTPVDLSLDQEDQVAMIHMRRYLDHLSDRVVDKDYVVQKTRDEMYTCREHIVRLEKQRDEIFKQLEDSQHNQNIAAEQRLRVKHTKVCEELWNEELVLGQIQEELNAAEFELSKAQLEQGKHVLEEAKLEEAEEQWGLQRLDQAINRSNKENESAMKAKRRKVQQDRKHMEAMKDEAERRERTLLSAKLNHERHNKFLQETVSKLQKREKTEQEREHAHMEKRMTSMLALKTDIAANRENMRAIEARDKALSDKEKEKKNAQSQGITERNGNPLEEMLKQSKASNFEKEKHVHMIKQREAQVKIAETIVDEQDRMERRIKQQPYLFAEAKDQKAKIVKPHKPTKLEAFQLYMKQNEPTSPHVDQPPSVNIAPRRGYDSSDDEDDDDYQAIKKDKVNFRYSTKSDSEGEQDDGFAKPEFDGMWDNHKPYKVPKESSTLAFMPGTNKMDKEIMQRVLEQHRKGIVIKQVAGGREFKGQAFYSKPDIIHFKDFDVGKQYKRKVILTNVSYTVNYCKLIGITEHLKDFIDVHFDPPGQMSAGLTCEMLVTFKPMINEELSGHVNFLAQTGPFSVPIICSIKKCELSVDRTEIDFGTAVIGETLRRYITLTNSGALPTMFDFSKFTGMKPETSVTTETIFERGSSDINSPMSKKLTTLLRQGKQSPEKADKVDKEKLETGQTPDGTIDNIGDPDDVELDMAMMYGDDMSDVDGVTIGNVNKGKLDGFSSIKLELIWQPLFPGKISTEYGLVFNDPLSDNIKIGVLAYGIDVPVWVERQDIDLKICMFDRLYQDTIVVNNRATTALRLKFDVCKQLKNHIELLPKTGYIQAQSKFTAQLKFLPRKSLLDEGSQYFDNETGVLQAPMVITVADQTRVVPFTVDAIVTTSDMSFNSKNIDFGKCTIYESVRHKIKLTNHSILPQKFGFVGLPTFVDVQPNDGFGTLLPLEEINIEIIFMPPKAKDYSFELTCKSLINREFKIKCKGVGVHPPLRLSHQVIHFAATALYDVSLSSIHVFNDHTSSNEFTHPVPRIGSKGEIAPVVPTTFEFALPENSPIAIYPSVGTVEPGKKTRVEVRFAPKLKECAIKKEAVMLLTKMARQSRATPDEKLSVAPSKKLSMAKIPKGQMSPKVASSKQLPSQTPAAIPVETEIDVQSNEYATARVSLLRQYPGQFDSFVVPCYAASGKCENPGMLRYSVHNTLYLEVFCPARRPELIVISDNGHTTCNFGDISIGQRVIKSITVQNISKKEVSFKTTVLDTLGPFNVLNASRPLAADSTHSFLVAFAPTKGETFQESLDVVSAESTLHLHLKGNGVQPVINVSVENNVFDLGTILANEYREETFTISNTTALAVQFAIKLNSQSLLRYKHAQVLPQFVETDPQENILRPLVGPQNNNGQIVFDCIPTEGLIPPGSSKEIMITFAPDHPSDQYSDYLHIHLFGQDEIESFQLVGEAKPRIMYMSGGDDLTANIESLATLPQAEVEEPDVVRHETPLLVTLYSVAEDDTLKTVSRDIYVGCVRTMAVSQKKNGEFTFDNIQPLVNVGINIDPIKGMLEAGTKKPITISWSPHTGFNPSKPISTSINCTVKGDVTEVYKIMIRAFVTSK